MITITNPSDHPILHPLIADLVELHVGSYLRTNEFRKYTIKINIHNAWDQFYQQAKSERRIFGLDFENDDCENALRILFSRCYDQSQETFHLVAGLIIQEFISAKNITIGLGPLIETLELLEFPTETIDAIKKHDQEQFEIPTVPVLMNNAEQLEKFLERMSEAIASKDYNLALTYAYSCLEGLFKAYITAKLPATAIPLELQKQAALVRDDIKKKLDQPGQQYPEQMVMLIATITSAVSNARNGHSVSHFDGNADRWLGEFARDCVNSVARMVLHFII